MNCKEISSKIFRLLSNKLDLIIHDKRNSAKPILIFNM